MPNHEPGSEPSRDRGMLEGQGGGFPMPDPPQAMPAPPPGAPMMPMGAPPPMYLHPAMPPQPTANSIANTGGTLGIIAFVLGWIPILGIFVGWPLGVLAIIFGALGIGRANRMGGLGKGMAVTGLVLGILTVVFKSIPGFNLL